MNQDRTGYSLHKAMPLEQALAILQREMEHQAIPRWREIAFNILNYATYTYGVAAAVFIACHFLYHATGSSDKLLLFRIPFAFVILVGITIIISFCLNVPYFIRLARHLLLARRLGLSEALLAPWRAAWGKNWWRHAMVLFIVVVSLYVPFTYFVMKIRILDYAPLTGWLAWARLLVSLLLTGILIVAILSTPLMRSARACLDCVNQLYSSLKRQEQSAAHQDTGLIHVPAETYETIAKIERAQISRERMDSIVKSALKAQDRYTVQKSSEAREQERSLDVSTQLRVENQIDNLTLDPFPEGMSEYLDTGELHLPVPDTPVVIAYSVETTARNVQIISIEHQSDPGEAPQGSSR